MPSRFLLAFSSLAHTYSHLLMLLYPTVVLALGPVHGLAYDELVALALPGFVLFGAGALPAGWLGDRWSSSAMMVIFFVGTGAGAMLTGLACTPLEISAGLGLIGLFASIYHPVGIAWLVRNAPNPGRALGINGVFGSLGTAGGALVAGGLTDALGWRAAFLVPGAFCVATGIAFLWALKRRAVVAPLTARAAERAGGGGHLRQVFALLAFATVMIGLIYQSTTVGLPKLLSERFEGLAADGMFGVGLLVAVVYVAAGVAQVLGGELADRFDLKRIYAFGLLMGVPLALAAFAAGHLWFVAAAAALMAVQAMVMPAENSLLARYTPLRWRARAFGMKFVLTLGVSSVGVVLVPLLHRLTGSLDSLFLVVAAMTAAAGLAALRLPRQVAATARAQTSASA